MEISISSDSMLAVDAYVDATSGEVLYEDEYTMDCSYPSSGQYTLSHTTANSLISYTFEYILPNDGDMLVIFPCTK